MIKEYFENYFEKIKATKKVARDKNIGVWWMIGMYYGWIIII